MEIENRDRRDNINQLIILRYYVSSNTPLVMIVIIFHYHTSLLFSIGFQSSKSEVKLHVAFLDNVFVKRFATLFSLDIDWYKFSCFGLFFNKVMLYIYVFCSFIVSVCFCHIDYTIIINKQYD